MAAAARAPETAKCLGCGREMQWIPGDRPGTPRCSIECAQLDPAVAWYRALLRVAPNRRDTTIDDLLLYVQRAPAVHRLAKQAIGQAFLSMLKGEATCPHCNDHGPHETNRHHRFYRFAFTCRCCGKAWLANRK